VLIRFPSKEAFDQWYRSPEYQELAKTRWASSTASLVLIEERPATPPRAGAPPPAP
jgi:uncharacterized protein (DUF1330 family)